MLIYAVFYKFGEMHSTMNDKQIKTIEQLESFKGLIIKYYNAPTAKLRTQISRSINHVEKIVRLAGAAKRVTISPPPMVGGYQFNNANPFNLVFDAPYGMDMTQVIIDMIDEAIGVIEVDENFGLITQVQNPVKADTKMPDHKKVFLVHGHDQELKEKTARFLSKLGLDPIILHEQSNRGQTIIEKFEKHSDVSYAVVLLSPDDVGRSVKDDAEKQHFRARQNVIFELGYFIGKLGRNKVCAVIKGGVETPSDYDGILYLQYDDADGWKMFLAKELKNAGLPVDLNKAI
ncbi:hypothetical protein SRABI27_03774 [Pedobacter sp. Bi27]|nr:hypothetical protein SRABI27_03774 [Pedobacter sp. Bi27]